MAIFLSRARAVIVIFIIIIRLYTHVYYIIIVRPPERLPSYIIYVREVGISPSTSAAPSAPEKIPSRYTLYTYYHAYRI